MATKGISITFVIGSWGGVYVSFTQIAWRICLGWVALTIYPKTDIEKFFDTVMQEQDKLKESKDWIKLTASKGIKKGEIVVRGENAY